MGNQIPNLFSYATSELSQDAFICWLAAWADPKFQTADLHQTAREFIVSMIRKEKSDYDDKCIRTVDISRQKTRIDVLIEINKDADDKLAILIEDKTHTNVRKDQLLPYLNTVKNKRFYRSDTNSKPISRIFVYGLRCQNHPDPRRVATA